MKIHRGEGGGNVKKKDEGPRGGKAEETFWGPKRFCKQ